MGCCTSGNETKAGGPRAQGAYDAAVENRGDSTYTREDLLVAAEHCKIHNTLKAACDIRLGFAAGQ